ncbi:cilia- and flagella-associated protein 184-like [Eurosta solidaginis]|uniref:cilia- and flagella-associated protein 184-like n=1 Tax=Eurosta solidaginis TaxID=178769 RepID=UPI00353081F1
MELEEVSEEYAYEEVVASESYHSLLTEPRIDDLFDTKRVQFPVTGEENDSYTLNKYKKESRYRRYSENDEDNLDDPRWSTTVKPFNSSEPQQESEDLEDDDTQITNSLRLSFLEHFEYLPTIDEISSTLSEETIIAAAEEQPRGSSLVGKFVDPLTGIELSQQSFHSIQMEFEDFDVYEEEESTEDSDLCVILGSEDSELMELHELEVELEKIDGTKVDVAEHDEDINFEIITKEVGTHDKTFDEAVADEAKRECEVIVGTLIDELIEFIVKTWEYNDPKEILRKTINKKKLIDQISEKLKELEVEQAVRFYLNRKVVEHYKRKRAFRSIIDDSPDTVEYFMKKYKDQLEKYDKVMGREAELLNVMDFKTKKLKKTLADNEVKVRGQILKFEEIVKKTLLKEHGSQLPGRKRNDGKAGFAKNIFALLEKFKTARKEISDTRLQLIKKQHLYAELKGRLNELQNLGNGINFSQYEQLVNEVTQLVKKNEERNSELLKAHTTRIVDVHISTHFKDAVLIKRNALEAKKLAYQALLLELEDARRIVHKQKELRLKIRREAKEASHQGGILLKPVLMQDYDRTVDAIALKERSITALRSQYKKLNDKIAHYEHLLASRFHK